MQNAQDSSQEPEAPSPDVLGDLTHQISDAQWVPDWAQPVWGLLEAYPYIGSLVLILLGLVVARVVVALLSSFSGQLSRRTKTQFDDKLFELARRPVFLTVFYVFLGLALFNLRLSDTLTLVLVRILASIAVLVWMRAAFKIGVLLLQTIASWQDRVVLIESRTLPLFDIATKLVIFALGTYLLLQVWRIDATAWLASAGVLGIAVGFAARDTLANLFSGVFIVADAPYRLGDYIILDSGERGVVTHVGLRSTRILTRDDVEITIPNSVMGSAKIINEAGGRWTKMRVRIPVGVAYGSDVDEVCSVLEKVAQSHDEVCKSPGSRVRMRGFGDSSLDFELLAWIDKPEDRGRIMHELFMATYKALNAAEIEIPFPQRDLWVKQIPQREPASEAE